MVVALVAVVMPCIFSVITENDNIRVVLLKLDSAEETEKHGNQTIRYEKRLCGLVQKKLTKTNFPKIIYLLILINAPSLPLFIGKKVAKCHTKWLQDIENLVYLPIFCLKNVILGLLNCSSTKVFF